MRRKVVLILVAVTLAGLATLGNKGYVAFRQGKQFQDAVKTDTTAVNNVPELYKQNIQSKKINSAEDMEKFQSNLAVVKQQIDSLP